MGEGLVSIGKYTWVVSKISGWYVDKIDDNNSFLNVLCDTNVYQIRMSNLEVEVAVGLLNRVFGYEM